MLWIMHEIMRKQKEYSPEGYETLGAGTRPVTFPLHLVAGQPVL
jgi:hypothetical protein